MTIPDLKALAVLAKEPTGDIFLDDLFSRVDSAIYYRFAYRLIKHMKAGSICELGVYRGGCSAHMAAATTGRVLAVDNAPQEMELASILTRYKNIDIRRDLSTARWILDSVPDQSVDLLLVDTDHCCHQVMSEYGCWFQKMKPGSAMLFDDLHLSPEMERAWQVLARMSPQLERVELPELHHSGFGAILF